MTRAKHAPNQAPKLALVRASDSICVIYARVSSEDQRNNTSLENQRDAARRYALSKGFTCPDGFEIAVVESAKNSGRKEWGKALDLIRTGKARHLLVWGTDRLLRNKDEDSPIIKALVRDYDAVIHRISEGDITERSNLDDPTRWISREIRELFAQHENMVRRSRTQTGQSRLVEAGMFPGLAPDGYKNVRESGRNFVVLDPGRIPFIQRAFELYSSGRYSLTTLATALNAEGFRVRTGKILNKDTFAVMFNNPFYAGEFIWKAELYKGSHQPIISRDQWDAVQRVLAGNACKQPGSNRQQPLLFMSLLTCGYCGCAITGYEKKNQYRYYRCTHHLGGQCGDGKWSREEVLEEQFLAALRTLQLTPGMLEALRVTLKAGRESQVENQKESEKSLRNQLTRLGRRLETLYDDRLDGRCPAAIYDKKSAEIQAEQVEIQGKLAELTITEHDYLKEGSLLLELAQRADSLYLEGDASERRELIELVTEGGTWQDHRLVIRFRAPFSFLATMAGSGSGGSKRGLGHLQAPSSRR